MDKCKELDRNRWGMLLKTFNKHRAHFQRGDKQIEEFLREYFDEYLDDIKSAIERRITIILVNNF